MDTNPRTAMKNLASFPLVLALSFSTASCFHKSTGPSKPDSPSDLQVTLISLNSVQLTWADNSDDETGFIIEHRPPSSSEFSEIAQVGDGVTSYIVTDLDLSSTHYFRICACRDAVDSDYSNLVNISIEAGSNLGQVAVNFTATDQNGQSVSLNDYYGEVILINLSADW